MVIKFGDRLKELREQKKLTQPELASIFNVHKTTISNWEKSKRFPDEEILNKLANYFDVSMDYLLGKESNKEDISIPSAILRRAYIETSEDGKIVSMLTGQLVKRLIDENVIDKNGNIDNQTLELIKEAIKIDAKLSSNLKKDAND